MNLFTIFRSVTGPIAAKTVEIEVEASRKKRPEKTDILVMLDRLARWELKGGAGH